jgi:hypothetical protein
MGGNTLWIMAEIYTNVSLPFFEEYGVDRLMQPAAYQGKECQCMRNDEHKF